MKKGKYMIGTLAVTILLSFSGCSMINTYLNYDNKANEIVDAFEQGDMKTINSIVFGANSLPVDEEAAEEESTGLLSHIFEAAEIKVKYTDVVNKQIVYEITAPDLSDIFDSIPEDQAAMTEEEFERYVLEYIETADFVTTTVRLPYTDDGGMLEANYENPEFINAVTGGFLDAYKDVYQKAIEEYLEELEGAE